MPTCRASCSGRPSPRPPPEIYRALIEATAFGTRVIIDAFEAGGLAIDQVVGCGGLPERNRAADADLRRRHRPILAGRGVIAGAGPRVGDVRGGRGRDRPPAATGRSRRPPRRWLTCATSVYDPIEANRRVYDRLYGEYVRLHDLFGRGGDPAMKTLKQIRLEALEGARTSA